MHGGWARGWVVPVAILMVAGWARADEQASQRYGLLGLLDRRSIYGQYWFPEPLRGPEMDVDRELRVDWFHGEGSDAQVDELKAEVEWNFDLLTLELEVPYERQSASFMTSAGAIARETQQAVGSIELAARHPVFQYVSADERFDYTLVAALEVALPSGSAISEDTEIVPQVFQLLRLGERWSVQTSVGVSNLIGPDAGGTNALEYNVVVGYDLEGQVTIPGVMRIVPLVELNGQTGLSGDDAGHNALFGTAGARFNLEPIGDVQPRLGLGYVFPIDAGAQEELDWGIVTSLVFEL